MGKIDDVSVLNARLRGDLTRSRKRFRLIDLFAGAGGMTLGFTGTFGHSFTPIWANDFNKWAADTYNANFGNHCVCGDIVDILEDPNTIIPRADVVIGGPPCQGFSLLNKEREGDPRRRLWHPFMEVVKRSEARVFVIENVPQLIGSFEHGEILGMAEAMGFRVSSSRVCAADYGVPQVRWRAFIIGSRTGNPDEVFPPRKTHCNFTENGRRMFTGNGRGSIEEPEPWRTVRDAIGDLPAPAGTEVGNNGGMMDLHFGRVPTGKSLSRYKAIPKEGMNRFDLQRRAPDLTPACWIRKTSGGTDLFGRLWWGRPAVTIRTEFFKPEKGRYLHPTQHRPITHREAARFQSFPDTFRFTGSKIEMAKQIGNAVPPLLAARIADCVYALLSAK